MTIIAAAPVISADPAAVRQWLAILHGDSPGRTHVCSTLSWSGRTFGVADRDAAVDYVAQLDRQGAEGVYVRVTTLAHELAPGKRGSAADSAALPALWADLDLAGPGHKHELCPSGCELAHAHVTMPLPPDEAAGRAVIEQSKVPEPTLWIHSGGGLYPIWMLSQPHLVDEQTIAAAKALAAGWQRVIEQAAARLGYWYGRGVGDLARVLRIPGTINRKDGLARPCRIVAATGTRYTMEQLVRVLDAAEAWTASHLPAAERAVVSAAPGVVGALQPVTPRVESGITPGDDFAQRATWAEILEPAGWREHYQEDAITYWTRPGKHTGTSASTNATGTDHLHVFTTAPEALPLEGGESYSKLGAYSALHHQGDHAAAVRQLASLGYGTPLPSPAEWYREAFEAILGKPLPEVEVPEAPAEERGGTTTMLLPSPTNPMAVARELISKAGRDGRIVWWRGDFYERTETCWRVWSMEAVNRWIYQTTEHAVYFSKDKELCQWAPSRRRVADLREALGHGVVQRPEQDEPDDGDGLIAFSNGALEIAKGELGSNDPERFNLHALEFPYDKEAKCDRWLKFLGETLEGDAERIAILQEWFGYVLIGGTELQKILSMFGPKRSGKGTIIRILRALVGQRYTVAPSSLDSLAGTFGMESLIGARLAVLADIQWTGSRVNEAIGILLGVSGEDAQTVNRKHKTSWSGQLPTRFMLAGNDRPRFRNTSGALASRMIHIQFRISAYGREDPRLTGKLLAELPGIFNWSLQGWKRLTAAGGKFTTSRLAEEAARQVERQASPVTAFVQDMCAEEGYVALDTLYREYERWRTREDLGDPSGKPNFSRDLKSAFPMISVERRGPRSGRERIVTGLRLLIDGIEDPEQAQDQPYPARYPAYPAYPATEDDLQSELFAAQA